MTEVQTVTSVSKRRAAFWIGWVLTLLVSAFLLLGATMNLSGAKVATDGLQKYGYPANAAFPLGVVTSVSVLLYLFPRTAVLGAILLTGYLGGAVATHVRAGEPWFLAVTFGVLTWLALYLRESRLRALTPWRT